MSWAPLNRPASSRTPSLPAISVSMSVPKRRHVGGLHVLIRPVQLPGVSFIRPGALVTVFGGEGEHAGMLRIVPGKEFRIGCNGGRGGTSGTYRLRLQIPPGVTACDRKPEAVTFRQVDGAIEVTLPTWAQTAPPAPPPRPADAPAAIPATRGSGARHPYRGITERVADPAAALRGVGGRFGE